MKPYSLFVVLALSLSTPGQTPPVKIDTPDIPVPPPLVVPGATGPDDTLASQPLTLDEALRIALVRQPRLGIATGQLSIAQGRATQARSDLGPQFTIALSGTETSRLGGSGELGGGARFGFSTQANASVSQLLFDFGRTRALARRAETLSRAAEFNLTRTQMEVALEVRQSFYGLLQATRFVSVSEGNVRGRQSQLALAEARIETGLGAPSDALQAKTALAEATIALTNARLAEVRARIDLALALGVDARTLLTVADSTETDPPGSLADWVEKGFERRPEIRQAEAEIVAAQLGLTAARRTSSPSVGVSGTLAGRGREDSPVETRTGSVGVFVTWPFGDSGLTAGRIREAQGEFQAAEAVRTQVAQVVTSQIVDAALAIVAAEQRLVIAQAQAENARRFAEAAQGRYGGGVGTFLEVVSAQDLAFAAERNLVNARADLDRARATLKWAIGSP